MKRISILTFVLVAVLAVPALAQKKYLRQFHRKYVDKAETHRIGVGGFFVKLASWVIPAEGDEDTKNLKRILGKVGGIKIYTIESENGRSVINPDDIAALKQKLVKKGHFESLMEVRSDGDIVHVMNSGKDDEIGNLVVLVNDDDQMVMIHLRTRLKMSDLDFVMKELGNKGFLKPEVAKELQEQSPVSTPAKDSSVTSNTALTTTATVH
ncbi:DUF4252 domain-containing protein [Chitinophaga pendula]|uniref:DUF4252 domain-containing protein n=1 Tax=Chitinophaga TaxID=79328 RepID=UPI000BB077A8|nr:MULTISPECIES: DUF4252 domain-containing protein [Chitinophaga]ASZ12834.1 hypothetical protein CK934_18670 [Chitinophaga sp. MD30]UCJ09538.1 DUF4252 domain-containing protein [Chitinophaga pendula]